MTFSIISNKISRPWGILATHNRGTEREYKTGVYVHPKGIAQVYTQHGYIEICFVVDGKFMIKKINTAGQVTDRSAFIHAGKFIKSIV